MFPLFLFLSGFVCSAQVALDEPEKGSRRYEFRKEHDPSGIGKFYFGREIAHVMSHRGAAWLERPERVEEEKPDVMIQALPIKAGDAVADIGAGSGYITERLARVVGPKGMVYAVEIQPEMLALLEKKMDGLKLNNVVPVLGTVTDPNLPPNSIDLALMVDVYHEFSHPYEMVNKMAESLKPGGRLVFVEYRGEDPAVPIKPLHKMSEAQVKKEMADHPLTWEKTLDLLPRQHIIIFQKNATKEATDRAPKVQ